MLAPSLAIGHYTSVDPRYNYYSMYYENSPLVVLSTVSCILTDPGPLCAGRTVVLNCTGGQGHEWMYDMSMGIAINTLAPPPAEPVVLSGVQFTFSQLSPSPNLITQITFMSKQEMNGRILTCSSVSVGILPVTSEVTFAINSKYLTATIIPTLWLWI